MTALSVLFAVAAALAFWQASRPALVAGAVLLYLGFVLDCVDGQLARYTRRFGAFGGWLDTMADRAKEYAVYAGLAAGAERMGLPYAWPLAITAIVLQTVRHMTDTWYGALHDEASARQAVGTAGNADAGGGVGARLSRASNKVQADTGSAAYWLKRIVVFPIGERWALIAILAALTTGGWRWSPWWRGGCSPRRTRWRCALCARSRCASGCWRRSTRRGTATTAGWCAAR